MASICLDLLKKHRKKNHCLCVRRKYFLIFAFENSQICTSMVMKKAGYCSVPSNPTGECTTIFLPSLNDFLLDYALRHREPCPMCEKIFPYLCILETDKYVPKRLWKRLAIVLSLQTKLVSAQQYFWYLWTIFYQIMR